LFEYFLRKIKHNFPTTDGDSLPVPAVPQPAGHIVLWTAKNKLAVFMFRLMTFPAGRKCGSSLKHVLCTALVFVAKLTIRTYPIS